MSDLQFNITAKDQASRVVGEVQKKVTEFGKDIGRSVMAMVGPMALITAGVTAIASRMEEMKQKAKDAFDWGSGLSASAAAMGLSVEQFQKLQEIASRTGQSFENVGKAFKAASNLITEASTGNKDAQESIQALGFNLSDLERLKPEDIVGRLGDALASIENPTDKAAAAFAAFGAEGKALIQTLERIRGLVRAPAGEGLTQEEADFLAESKRQEEAASNREKVRIARETSTARFLQTDAGKQILNRERNRMREAIGGGGGVMGGASPADLITAESLATNPQIQKEVQAEMVRRARMRAAMADADAAAAALADPAAAGAGSALTGLGKARQAKPTPEPKVKPEVNKVERPQFAVSSLRSIGGGMAGEIATAADIAHEQVDLQRAANKLLEDIKGRLPGGAVDQTKYGNGGQPGAMTPATAGSLAVNS